MCTKGRARIAIPELYRPYCSRLHSSKTQFLRSAGSVPPKMRPQESKRVKQTMWAPHAVHHAINIIVKADTLGDSITAQEKSFGNVPFGSTRTRNTPSWNTVRRTFAGPAANSTPSFSFSTLETCSRCCQPCAEMDEKNHQMAHRRMPVGGGILRNHGRNNNSPATRIDLDRTAAFTAQLKVQRTSRLN